MKERKDVLFMFTGMAYIIAVVVSVVAGAETHTGPDAMITSCWPLLSGAVVLGFGIYWGYLLVREGADMEPRDRAAGRWFSFGAVPFVFLLGGAFELGELLGRWARTP